MPGAVPGAVPGQAHLQCPSPLTTSYPGRHSMHLLPPSARPRNCHQDHQDAPPLHSPLPPAAAPADLINVFEVFLPQLLLYPNPTDPLNGEAAALLMREPQAYNQKVKGRPPSPMTLSLCCLGQTLAGASPLCCSQSRDCVSILRFSPRCTLEHCSLHAHAFCKLDLDLDY